MSDSDLLDFLIENNAYITKDSAGFYALSWGGESCLERAEKKGYKDARELIAVAVAANKAT